ncbi:MAG: DUF3299 domain-containing protein [Pelagibacterales bacterium]|nr:DUF3299 domain-containing protein [Pelagibacterales bacterium]
MKKILFIISSFFLLCAFKIDSESYVNSEIAAERKLQETLPKSNHPIWQTLQKSKIKHNTKTGLYSATHDDEIKKMVGTEIEVGGFLMPLSNGTKFKHFFLSKRTPTCFFCPPGEPNEVIEIYLKKENKWEENLVKIRGKFSLVNNQELGLFFKVTEGEIIK